MRWRIYYTDGSTFSSADGDPEDAPAFGVQVVVQWSYERGRDKLHLGDCYYYDCVAGTWYNSDKIGALLAFARYPRAMRALKHGEFTTDENFKAIMARADADADFPPKAHSTPQREKPFGWYGVTDNG